MAIALFAIATVVVLGNLGMVHVDQGRVEEALAPGATLDDLRQTLEAR